MARGRRVSALRHFDQKEVREMNIYIGNLSWETTDGELKQAFEEFGEVSRATVIRDKFSGKSKGFGFVEMPDEAKGAKAIEEMDGRDMGGRMLRVSKAKPKANGGEKRFERR